MPGEDIQSWSTTALDNGNSDTSINFLEGQARASVNNSARSVMAAHAKNRNLQNGSIVTTGTANAQAFVSGVGYTVMPVGLRVLLKIGATLTNTGPVTLNMDSIGDVAIKNQLGADLTTSDLTAGGYAELIVAAADTWVLMFSIPAVAQPPAVVPVGPPVVVPPGTPATSADFITGITAAYDSYLFEGINVVPATDLDGLVMRFSQDVGATWKSGAADYMWGWHLGDDFGNHSVLGNTADNRIQLTSNALSNAAGMHFSFSIRLINPGSTTMRKTLFYNGVSTHPGVGTTVAWWAGSAGFKLNTDPINGVRFFLNNGSIASGTFRMSASGPTA